MTFAKRRNYHSLDLWLIVLLFFVSFLFCESKVINSDYKKISHRVLLFVLFGLINSSFLLDFFSLLFSGPALPCPPLCYNVLYNKQVLLINYCSIITLFPICSCSCIFFFPSSYGCLYHIFFTSHWKEC